MVTDYTYNGFNQRLRKTSAGVTTYYSYDEAGHLQGEYAADGSLLAEHLWLGDTPIATVQRQADGSLATYYVFADQIDTPRALSDANGKILWRWDGEGFGRSPPDADADGDGVALTYNLRFPGQVFDKESNLHYNWNRYYDPLTGRYVSSDPIGLAGGSFTTYGYVGGNPVSQFDPDGKAVVVIPVIIEASGWAWNIYRGWRTAQAIANAANAIAQANDAKPPYVTDPAANAEWQAYKKQYEKPPPPNLDKCELLRWKLKREEDLLAARQAWDAKWGNHHGGSNGAIAQSQNAVKNARIKLTNAGCPCP